MTNEEIEQLANIKIMIQECCWAYGEKLLALYLNNSVKADELDHLYLKNKKELIEAIKQFNGRINGGK